MKILTCLFAALLLLPGFHAAAQSPKVGFVNSARIQAESVLNRRMVEELKKEFAAREQQLQALQKQGIELRAQIDKEGDKLPPAERQAREKSLAAVAQQFEQLRRNTAEDFELARREKLRRVLEQVNAAIKTIAEAGNYDLIVQEAVYSNRQTDITDEVLKEIARRAGN